MNVVLIVCGKTTDKNLQVLTDDYVNRLSHYCDFSVVTLPQVKNNVASESVQKQREADQIFDTIRDSDFVILFDENGKQYSSPEFAAEIERYQLRGIKRAVFIIGGPYGFAPSVYDRANHKISLSKMTFSHQMVRLFAVEQIYRAFTILKGEKYHHI